MQKEHKIFYQNLIAEILLSLPLMTDWTNCTSTSPTPSVEGTMGSKVISVLCDSIRSDTKDAIHNAALNIMLNYHAHKDSWETESISSPCDVSITKTKINKHTVVNIIKQGPANSDTIVSSDGAVDKASSSMNVPTPKNPNDSPLATDYESDFIVDTQSTKRPTVENTLRSPRVERAEITKATVVPSKQNISTDHKPAPPKSFKLSSSSAASQPPKPHSKSVPNQDMTVPCQAGALRGPSGSRNVQRVGDPLQTRRNITTEVILLPSTRGASEPTRQKIRQAEPVTLAPPRRRNSDASDAIVKSIPPPEELPTQDALCQQYPQQQYPAVSSKKQIRPTADELESSPCDTPTYSNPLSFQRETVQRQTSAPQERPEQSKQDKLEEAHTHADVNPQVICLPTVHRYNSPQLLSSSRKPSRQPQDLTESSMSSTSSCQPVNQSSPRLPHADNHSLKAPVTKSSGVEQQTPYQTEAQRKHPATHDVDPGEVWPRYDADYAKYLKYIGKGMGPWDGSLDTTWDLSTIDYSVYDDEPGQLPINTANPKYITTGLPINLQGHVIPPGLPPTQGYDYEEGECLPSGTLADGYAIHYFKQGHYMGSGQASNNYQAVNSDGVTYDLANSQQHYLNGIMYRQQYSDYIANNPYSQNAINCGRNHYYQQRLHEEQLHNAAMQEQYNQYLYSLHQHAQFSEAIMPTLYQQRYQLGHPNE